MQIRFSVLLMTSSVNNTLGIGRTARGKASNINNAHRYKSHMRSPPRRMHQSHLDVDKQYFNEVSSEEVVMNVAGICRGEQNEWLSFRFLHADAYGRISFDCNANGAMASVNQCQGVEISIFK